jgi:hypothetical protein
MWAYLLERKTMKQIILSPVVVVSIDDEGKISIDMMFADSIGEALDEDGEFREVTDEERTLINEKVIPFIPKEINL